MFFGKLLFARWANTQLFLRRLFLRNTATVWRRLFLRNTAARGAIRPAGKYAPLFAITPSNIASKRPTGTLHHRFIVEQTTFRRPRGRIRSVHKDKAPNGRFCIIVSSSNGRLPPQSARRSWPHRAIQVRGVFVSRICLRWRLRCRWRRRDRNRCARPLP